MENNSNAIAEIQKKYAGCNLLMPAATGVQLNPFFKITVMEVIFLKILEIFLRSALLRLEQHNRARTFGKKPILRQNPFL